MEVRGSGNFQLFARSGNVDNPDRNWSRWKQVDLQKDLPIDAPPARFIQWKAVLQPAAHMPVIDSVIVNYLPRNVAPEVDSVTVMVGWRVPAGAHTEPEGSASTGYEPPLPTIKDRHSIVVKWSAHDDNDDTLAYDIYYRGDAETRWKLLRQNVEERFINLDSDLFPDGGYTIRVVASDSPSHSAEDALTGDATSARFEIDNTPPQVESLKATVDGGKIRVTFRAVDSFSPISHAEYSIDAGEGRRSSRQASFPTPKAKAMISRCPCRRTKRRPHQPQVSPRLKLVQLPTSTPSSCVSTTASTTWGSVKSW